MLQLTGIHKVYPGGRIGLSIPSLTIPDGQVAAVVGANGSGKTTLLKTIMGLGELEEGTVTADGRPVREQYALMAFMTEEGSFPVRMTPRRYGEFLAGFYPGFDGVRYMRLLEFFELDPDMRMGRLSRGQRSKAEICAGFARGAKYLLMDEPFLGKDVFARRDFLKLMISSLKQDETIVIATHLADEIEHAVDRAVILQDGRIRMDIEMDDMRMQGLELSALMAEAAGYRPDRYKQFMEE